MRHTCTTCRRDYDMSYLVSVWRPSIWVLWRHWGGRVGGCMCSALGLSHLRMVSKMLLRHIVNLPCNGQFFISSLNIHNFSMVSKWAPFLLKCRICMMLSIVSKDWSCSIRCCAIFVVDFFPNTEKMFFKSLSITISSLANKPCHNQGM